VRNFAKLLDGRIAWGRDCTAFAAHRQFRAHSRGTIMPSTAKPMLGCVQSAACQCSASKDSRPLQRRRSQELPHNEEHADGMENDRGVRERKSGLMSQTS